MRRTRKARRDALISAARNGVTVMRDGEPVGSKSAAEVRAELVRASRKHEARVLAGHDDDESIEAKAGAILEAETACDVHDLAEIARAWYEAHKK